MRWGRGAKQTSWCNFESLALKPKTKGFRSQPSLCLCWVGKCGRRLVRWIWEANDGANRGCCSVDATLAFEETFPMLRLRHEADVFYWYDTTEASKDHHQLRSGSSRRLVFRRCWRIHLQRHDGRGCCELCRVESPCVRFNRESSRMILICYDLRSNVLGYLPLQVMPHRVKKRAIFLPLFSIMSLHFFDQNAKMTFDQKKVPF